jgi:hypothetical protein
MKKTLLLSLLVLTVVSCGKTNIISTKAPIVNAHNNSLTTSTTATTASLSVASFIGNYDLVEQEQLNCGASLQIIKGCDGIKLLTNHREEEEERFCDINKGELDYTNTTLIGNQITQISNAKVIERKHEERHFEERKHNRDNNEIRQQSITHILKLSPEGVLEEEVITNGQSKKCFYFKR